jgi:hypothetical protein
MPYYVENPAGAAAGAAAGFFQGERDRKQQDIQLQDLASQNALRQAQADYYQQFGLYRKAQSDQQEAKGRQLDAMSNVLYPSEANKNNAAAGQSNANAQLAIQGKLPDALAQANLRGFMPQYLQGKLQYDYQNMDAREQMMADRLASQIQIAGLNDDTRRALGVEAYQRALAVANTNGQNGITREQMRDAMLGTVAQYQSQARIEAAQYGAAGNVAGRQAGNLSNTMDPTQLLSTIVASMMQQRQQPGQPPVQINLGQGGGMPQFPGGAQPGGAQPQLGGPQGAAPNLMPYVQKAQQMKASGMDPHSIRAALQQSALPPQLQAMVLTKAGVPLYQPPVQNRPVPQTGMVQPADPNGGLSQALNGPFNPIRP